MEKSDFLKQIKSCNMDEPFVFVSYSSLDHQRVWEDVLRFQQMGYNVWLDERNLDKTKNSWRADAIEAIRDINCSLLVFYVSRHSLVSQACFAELESTVEETTQATHNGPVKFIAVDVEPIDDIIQFQQQVYTQIRGNKELSKEDKMHRLVTLHKCISQFFDSNNEKVRVKAKDLTNRKMDYYEEIVAAFPDESRIFFQADKQKETPAPKKQAVLKREENISAPAVIAQPYEILEMPYDFLEDIRMKFEKNEGKQRDPEVDAEEKESAEIQLAIARRKREPFSFNFTIIDEPGNTSRAFYLEEILLPQDGKWILMLRVRQIPYTEEPCKDGIERHFRVEGEGFTDNLTHNGLILTIPEETGEAFLNSFCVERSEMYVSRNPAYIGKQELDEDGYGMDSDLEALFAFCDVEGSAVRDFCQPVCWRRSVSKYRPEYLGYLILNAQTMEEIPKSFKRSPQGEYELSVVLPCPAKLCILQVTSDVQACVDDSYAVAGYLHGIYGMKKNPIAAERMMRKKAENKDGTMAFEYGAFLRLDGKAKEAEKYLRMAAEGGNQGAKFELAELLLERSEEDGAAEAEVRQLVDELWSKGRRTYGSDISIDLLGEHQPCEE